MKKTLLTPLVLLLAQTMNAQAQPQLNLQEGSLNWKKQDEFAFANGSRLEIERSYSSRSDYRGILGLGWCSELEWTLVHTETSNLLMKCDEPEVLAPRDVFLVPGQMRVRRNGRTLAFHTNGRLEGFEARNRKWVIQRDLTGKALLVHGAKGECLSFQYQDRLGLLSEVSGAKEKVLYRFREGMLAEVKGQGFETEIYDEFGNLAQLQTGAGLWKIRYDGPRDIVTWIRDNENCETNIEYESKQIVDHVSDRVITKKTCPNRKTEWAGREYRYLKIDDEVRLERTADLTEGVQP